MYLSGERKKFLARKFLEREIPFFHFLFLYFSFFIRLNEANAKKKGKNTRVKKSIVLLD